MTESEIIILDKLSEAWNEFLKLEIYHPDDTDELRFHIHAIQTLIMARKAVRDCPNIFNKI